MIFPVLECLCNRAFGAGFVPVFQYAEAVFTNVIAKIFFKFPVAIHNLVVPVDNIGKTRDFIEQLLVVFLRYGIPALIAGVIETDVLVKVIAFQGTIDVKIQGIGC